MRKSSIQHLSVQKKIKGSKLKLSKCSPLNVNEPIQYKKNNKSPMNKI